MAENEKPDVHRLRHNMSVLRSQTILMAPLNPNNFQVQAMEAAADAIRDQGGDERMERMLRYHVKNPRALLFDDKYTLAMLEAGEKALLQKTKKGGGDE